MSNEKTEKVKKPRMEVGEFIKEWNSEKPLAQIAQEKGINEQSLKVRAIQVKKQLEEQKNLFVAALTEEKGKKSPNATVITKLEKNVKALEAFKLRERKGTGRKTGAQALLESILAQ